MNNHVNNSIQEFEFDERDFITICNNCDSPFDKSLKQTWSLAQRKEVFKYKISEGSIPTKVIPPGKFNMIAHLNEERGLLRRKPYSMTGLQMPFSHDRFNFTKVMPDEILFKLKCKTNNDQATVVINQSPIEYCSSVLVPRMNDCLPQVLTKESLRLAIATVALSGQKSLRVGFNSLGAMASVNHLHWHIYYYDYDLQVASLPVDEDSIIQHWPIKGFAFELESPFRYGAIDSMVEKCFAIADYCLDAEIAHNLFITRTEKSDKIRIIIWPREAVFDVKDDMKINVAFCEFTGFYICKTKHDYETINEDFCIDLLEKVDTRLEEIKTALKK